MMTQLREGQKAPVFKGRDQEGKLLSLDDFIGKKVILYFYPKDDTPGCTAEACNLRDNYNDLLSRDFVIIGISPDSENSHIRFRDKYNLPFSLIADPDKKIIKAYGSWGVKSMYGRAYEGVLRVTFIIDEEGKVLKKISKVDTKNHAAQILKVLGIN